MARFLIILTILAALCGPALAAVHNSGSEPVYSVAVARAYLSRDPRTWAGRTVLERGFLDGCPHQACPGHEPSFSPLLDVNQPASSVSVAWAGPDPVLAFLRRLPVLGALLPAPQVPHWGTVATYRVRLRVLAAGACLAPPCYEVQVLDAAL
jgi:hypothetical protein